MRELLTVVVILVCIAGFSLLKNLGLDTSMSLGWGLVAFGLLLGLPTAVIYHVLLYRYLKPRDQLPSGWIWRPLALNDQLTERERRWAMGWCYVGGLGFFIVVLGLIVLGGAILFTWASLKNF